MHVIVTVSIPTDAETPGASVFPVERYGQAISLQLGSALRVHMPGFNRVAADYARQIAAALVAAADECAAAAPTIAPPELPTAEADLADTFI